MAIMSCSTIEKKQNDAWKRILWITVQFVVMLSLYRKHSPRKCNTAGLSESRLLFEFLIT